MLLLLTTVVEDGLVEKIGGVVEAVDGMVVDAVVGTVEVVVEILF